MTESIVTGPAAACMAADLLDRAYSAALVEDVTGLCDCLRETYNLSSQIALWDESCHHMLGSMIRTCESRADEYLNVVFTTATTVESLPYWYPRHMHGSPDADSAEWPKPRGPAIVADIWRLRTALSFLR